jgi:hypothetical protein
MIRHFAAIALVLCVTPAPLYAEETHFTVTNATANVHKSPSTGAPVIGKATSGDAFTVTRELGSWVKISWPAADDGVGYLHVTWGRVSHGPLPAAAAPPANPAGRPRATTVAARTTATSSSTPSSGSGSVRRTTASTLPTTTATEGDGATGVQQAVSSTAQSINSIGSASTGTPTAHLLGFGGRIASTIGLGASVRAALTDRVGVQVELSRYTPGSIAAPQRLSSVQVAPSVLYSLPDKLTDYLWVRPYLGAGVTISRHTLSSGIPGDSSMTENALGRQFFGGTALAFAAAPRFMLSFDYGYRWSETPSAAFAGTRVAGRGLSVSGHWYVK